MDRSARPRRWGAWLSALALGLLACGTPEEAAPRHLVLISIDTLRADHLGGYGYARPTSPRLDAFARRGTLFEDVVTEASWTLPAHVTMLTGQPPWVHGVVRPDLGVGPGTPLLAERLRDAGFRTFGATEGGFVGRRYGFARGFERFDDEQASFEESLRDARAFLLRARREGDPRCFLFVQTFEVHCPYEPSEASAQLFRSPDREPLETAGRCGNPHFNRMNLTPGQVSTLRDLYDAGIRDADAALGDFLAWLEREDLLRETLVVVTSDHGEELGEHGRIGHEGTVHREVLGVPLVVVGPGVPAGRSARPAQLGDLVPTLLARLGVAGERDTLFRDVSPRRERYSSIRWRGRQVSLTTDRWHLIVDESAGAAWLYDRDDLREERDLAGEESDVLAELRGRVEAHARARGGGGAMLLDDPTAAEQVRLGQLGYGSGE